MVRKIGVKLSIVFILILFLIPFVFSLRTLVYVKEVTPGYGVTVNVLDPNSGDAIASVIGVANSAGEAELNFSSEKSTVDLFVIIRHLGKIVQTKKFTGYSTANPIMVGIGEPKPIVTTPPVNNTPAPIVNTTTAPTPPVNNTLPISNAVSSSASNKTKTNSSISMFFTGIKDLGSSIFSKIPWKIILYVVLGIVVIAVLVFVFIFAKDKFKDKYSHRGGSGIAPKVYFGSKSTPGISSGEERALRAAEEKIKSAQEEINMIRHRKEKIKEAERRLEQDKRELEKLRGRF